MHRFVLTAGATLTALIVSAAIPAQAKPPFAEKEGKPCAYCHINPGGGLPLNYRGLYYHEKKLTFEAFDDEAEAKKAGVPVGPDPDPSTKPKSWTAPPAEPPKPNPANVVLENPTVKQLEARAKAAAGIYKKKSKDPVARKNYAQALTELGHAQMLDESTPPRKRYPTALKTLRQALKLNPANAKAKEDIQLIEGAYKSMGKPVPK